MSSAGTSQASGAGSASPSGAPAGTVVRLQLQWAQQAQFAGYFAAVEQGYYAAENLDVRWLPGGPSIAPHHVGSEPDGPEFTVAWVPKVLGSREQGSQLVDIAQIFQRSGTLSVSWKDSDITRPLDMRGKTVSIWDFGNGLEVTAGTREVGLEPETDYTRVFQGVDMSLLLTHQVDVSQAMIYNEYAQILETVDPATGELYQSSDLNVINWNDEGSAMLQDAVFARADWLAQPGNDAVAIRFLKASFQGWIYCRDNPSDCIQYTINARSPWGAGHEAWMLNEVNPLIWPSPNGIGMMDEARWKQTVGSAVEAGVINAAPSADAYRTDLAAAALAQLAGTDTKGESFLKGSVELTPGGE